MTWSAKGSELPSFTPVVCAIGEICGSMARVPWIIDYPIVLEQMRGMKMRSLYYNSGAFGFADDTPMQSIGWIGPADETIRPEVRAMARQVAEPYAENLSKLLMRAWREILPGRIWVMPASHWAYELDFGSREWMPALLEAIGIDPGMLQTRTTAAAIEFNGSDQEEQGRLEHFVQRLLEMLQQSDFSIAFPGRRVVCSLHHHQQLWWTSAEPDVSDALAGLL
ncbi:MAG TPA: hypothetical protein VH518_22025 [Tepidisphaeraceae bacterium]